jgi:hypothetical protein
MCARSAWVLSARGTSPLPPLSRSRASSSRANRSNTRFRSPLDAVPVVAHRHLDPGRGGDHGQLLLRRLVPDAVVDEARDRPQQFVPGPEDRCPVPRLHGQLNRNTDAGVPLRDLVKQPGHVDGASSSPKRVLEDSGFTLLTSRKRVRLPQNALNSADPVVCARRLAATTNTRRGPSAADDEHDPAQRLAGYEVLQGLGRLCQWKGSVNDHSELAGLRELRKGAHQLTLVG